MTVDYLSAINQGGSGLNITQIVDSLVQAEQDLKKIKFNLKLTQKYCHLCNWRS